MSSNKADEPKGVTATEHLERTISNDAVLKVAEHADLEAIEETTPGKFVWLCACATAIGGMLFGYDVRTIPATLPIQGSLCTACTAPELDIVRGCY